MVVVGAIVVVIVAVEVAVAFVVCGFEGYVEVVVVVWALWFFVSVCSIGGCCADKL